MSNREVSVICNALLTDLDLISLENENLIFDKSKKATRNAFLTHFTPATGGSEDICAELLRIIILKGLTG